MTKITSIKLGLLALCIATLPLSLAQMPRIRTSGSNQIGTTAIRTPVGPSSLSGNSTGAAQLNLPSSIITGPNTNFGAHIGINAGAQTGISNPTGRIIGRAAGGLSVSSGNPTIAPQPGINALNGMNTGPNTNFGAHTGINPGAQTGISSQTGGMTDGVAGGLAASSGSSTAATQAGTNARADTSTKLSTNADAHTAAAAATPNRVNIFEPQFTPAPTPRALFNSDTLGTNFATPVESPSPVASASASASPTPTPTPPPL